MTAPTEVLDLLEATTAPGAQAMSEIPTWFVCVMGMGIVFIGLICLIILMKVVSAAMRGKGEQAQALPEAAAPIAPAPANDTIANRGELVAAVSCALAEELGRDVRAIRILKIEKVA